MPREAGRAIRVADQIRRELGDLLLREVSDPGLAGLVISDVEVSRDLAHAKVYYLAPGGADPAEREKALARAAGFLRRKLGERLRLRLVPELVFRPDTTLDTASRIEHLLETALPRDEEGSTEAASPPLGPEER